MLAIERQEKPQQTLSSAAIALLSSAAKGTALQQESHQQQQQQGETQVFVQLKKEKQKNLKSIPGSFPGEHGPGPYFHARRRQPKGEKEMLQEKQLLGRRIERPSDGEAASEITWGADNIQRLRLPGERRCDVNLGCLMARLPLRLSLCHFLL